MKKRVSQQSTPNKLQVSLLAVSSLVLLGGGCIANLQPVVSADSYSTQIQALRNQNASAQSAISSLQGQAATYQDAINQLQGQIDALQGSINANQAQQASLQAQIVEDQKQIDQEKAFLASDVKAMYVDGTPSTLEVLATSKNLSDFVDKQEYRTTVQNKLQDTMKKIAALQKQLQTQKAQVDQLLSELKTQQAQLDADQSQQQQLLSYNQDQQSQYTSQVQANNAKLSQLQAAQAAAQAAVTGNGGSSRTGASVQYKNFHTDYSRCGGGYSYCWAGYDQWVNDPWNLDYAHECVHYVADYLTREGKTVPNLSGIGNANMWPINAANHSDGSYGYLTNNPQHGDVVYMPLAYPGHVGIVEYANGDGSYHISQMNWPIGGYYSEMDLYVTSGVQFIHFN